MQYQTSDLRITGMEEVVAPSDLISSLPIKPDTSEVVFKVRRQAAEIISGRDSRLLVIVGPCSIHDPVSAVEYAQRLADISDELKEHLCIVMRVYFEKPRTTVGWKGLLNDPHLNGSFDINEGLYLARKLLTEIAALKSEWVLNTLIRSRRNTSATLSHGAQSGPGPPRAKFTVSWHRDCRAQWDSRTRRMVMFRLQPMPLSQRCMRIFSCRSRGRVTQRSSRQGAIPTVTSYCVAVAGRRTSTALQFITQVGFLRSQV